MTRIASLSDSDPFGNRLLAFERFRNVIYGVLKPTPDSHQYPLQTLHDVAWD